MIERETEIENELNQDLIDANEILKTLPGSIEEPSKHKVIWGDFLTSKSTSQEIDLIFTSPPYNADIKYDVYNDSRSIAEYKLFIEQFLEQSDKLLKPGGRIVINIRDIKVKSGSRVPPLVWIYSFLSHKNYEYRGQHIWYKGREESSTAWGSWKSSANPSIIDLFEHIFVFQKPGIRQKGIDNLTKEEFIESDLGVWKIRPVKKIAGKTKKNIDGHPCPFPVELALRVIKLYSTVGSTVLDPFGGTCATSIAAMLSGRNSISCDISKNYCEIGYTKLITAKGENPHISIVKSF